MTGTVILADALYRDPRAIIRADAPQEVEAAFAAIERALEEGHHLAGYFSYELGYLLEPKIAPLLPRERALPLLWFGVFDMSVTNDAMPKGRAYAGPLQHEWDEAA